MTPYPLNVQISLIVASIFHISAVYGPIALNMMLLWFFAIITLKLMTLSINSWAPLQRTSLERMSLEKTSLERAFIEIENLD